MFRLLGLFLLQIFVLFSPKQICAENRNDYEYYLCVTGIFNNDAPWLKEWIEYHRIIGVEHFLLYNNQSTDNYLEVLEPYINSGIVTLINWGDRPHNGGTCAWVRATQIPAHLDAIALLRGRTRWLAIIDTDEFIVPTESESLTDFLHGYHQFGALVVNWWIYGSSSVWDVPQNKLMIECLTRRASKFYYLNYVGKSIVQPEYLTGFVNNHYYSFAPGILSVDANGNPFQHTITHCLDKIRINHYYSRTLNYYINEKIPRKTRMDNEPPPSDEILNKILENGDFEEDEEKAIFRFIPSLRKQMGFD